MPTCTTCGLQKGDAIGECQSVGFFYVGPATTEIETARNAANANEATAKCEHRARIAAQSRAAALQRKIDLVREACRYRGCARHVLHTDVNCPQCIDLRILAEHFAGITALLEDP